MIDQSQSSEELRQYDNLLRKQEESIFFLRRDLKRLQKETIVDPKTELFSSAYFHSSLRNEMLRSERYRHFMTLAVLHLVSRSQTSTNQLTRQIRRIGQQASASLIRRTDTLAEFGKGQVALILPETERTGAEIVIDRLGPIVRNDEYDFRFSILSYPEDASNVEMMLTRIENVAEELRCGVATV